MFDFQLDDTTALQGDQQVGQRAVPQRAQGHGGVIQVGVGHRSGELVSAGRSIAGVDGQPGRARAKASDAHAVGPAVTSRTRRASRGWGCRISPYHRHHPQR